MIPISWRNRTSGQSKLAIQEMGSRYLFIVLYVFLEHHLSRGDYVRPELEDCVRAPSRARGPPGASSCQGLEERSDGISSAADPPGPIRPSSTGEDSVAKRRG